MEFSIVKDEPVEKEIQITVAAEEVDKVLTALANRYQQNSQVAGFRKGKAPLGLVEQKFHERIQDEATDALYNENIDAALKQSGLSPVSRMEVLEPAPVAKRGEDFSFRIKMEVIPTFDLPKYTGLEVEEIVHQVKPEQVEKVLYQLQKSGAVLKAAEGNGPARDGQVATVDFQAFENGEPVEDLKVTNYHLELGSNEALPEFEELVKRIPSGHTGEGDITFPEDFIMPKMAGKKVTMKVTVKEIKDYDLVPLDDELAKKHGFESMEDFRKKLEEDLKSAQAEMDRAVAQRQLLNQLLKQVDFPLPQSLVDFESKLKVIDMVERMQGRTPDILGDDAENMLAATRPYAEDTVRTNILLTTIAKNEKLEVSENELLMKVASDCIRHGDDVRETITSMRENGMLGYLHQKMLADKAMDFIYERSIVTRKDEQAE